MTTSHSISIDASRLLDSIQTLGRSPEYGYDSSTGGITRPSFSDASEATNAWFKRECEAMGLPVVVDGAGNLSCTLAAAGAGGHKTLYIGSHLDSVPNGGRLDGTYGVLVGLEVLRTIMTLYSESEWRMPFNITVMSCCEEEGAFVGCLGSRALSGKLNITDFENPRGCSEAELRKLMAASANPISPETSLEAALPQSNSKSHVGWFEVHIEQGPRLIESVGVGEDRILIGVVTRVVGICSLKVEFKGAAAHGGSTPMDRRFDALRAAAEFITAWHRVVREEFPECMSTIGNVDVAPACFNIVPGSAVVSVETRSESAEVEAKMTQRVHEVANAAALGVGLKHTATVTQIAGQHPASPPLDSGMMGCIESACVTLGLRSKRMLSYAGHDTQFMAAVMPSAMFFVPSIGGVSHCPQEDSHDSDLVNGANVMLQAVLERARIELLPQGIEFNLYLLHYIVSQPHTFSLHFGGFQLQLGRVRHATTHGPLLSGCNGGEDERRYLSHELLLQQQAIESPATVYSH